MSVEGYVKRHALSLAAFVWGFAEATLFFFVPDVLLSYIGLKRGVKAAAGASVLAAFGAALGGAAMYMWSAADPAAARAAVLAVPAISEAMLMRAFEAMREDWFMATMLGPLSSTPFKVYAILALHAGGAPLSAFALAGFVARLPRFLIVASGTALIGQALGRWLNERQLLWVLIGAWLLFYAVFFALMPN
jgi:membrane protein YqaA with SNARE-associated domain